MLYSTFHVISSVIYAVDQYSFFFAFIFQCTNLIAPEEAPGMARRNIVCLYTLLRSLIPYCSIQ